MQTAVRRFTFAATLFAAITALPLAAQSTVVYVGGNDLVVKAADGKVLNYFVPAGTTFASGGATVALAGLAPGASVTVPAAAGTPQVVASVQVVKAAKVYGTTPPDGITLTTSMGSKDFIVPTGSTFSVGGKSLALADLASDVAIDATIITPAAADAKVVPPPATPTMVGTLLVLKTDDLPNAGTNLPLYGAMGLVLLVVGFVLVRRKSVVA